MVASRETVLVTGATGFIGGRLVERLTLESPVEVRALVRDFHKAAWLARTAAQLVPGDLADPQALQAAMAGCATVYHCAAYVSDDPDQAQAGNVVGTRNVLEAAAAAGVRRVVVVSSVAVHRAPGDGRPVDERTPLVGSEAGVYARTKLQAEQEALRIGRERGVEVVILRPTIVYGPRAPLWTINFFRRIQAGRFALSGGIRGRHNFVYVDDVATALILAGSEPRAAWEAFLIGAEESVSWHAYLGCYARMAGRPLRLFPLGFLRLGVRVLLWLDSRVAQVRAHPAPWLRPVSFGLRALRRLLAHWRSLEPWELAWFRETHVYDVSKARDVLGFRAAPMTRAMDETELWLREQGYFPGVCWADEAAATPGTAP